MRSGSSVGALRHHVMLLDDDPDMLDLMRVILERQALSVRCFTDPGELFQALRTASPAIVITDLQIDELDGLDVCRRLTEHYSDVLCVVLSGDPTRRQAALGAGADLFLLKPIAGQSLVDALLGLVGCQKPLGRAH